MYNTNKTKMSGYKVFQCAAMDYHLEPARYETMQFTKLMARYEITMECDWVGAMQRAVDGASGDLMSVEDIRKEVAGAFYNDPNASGNLHASNANQQWHSLIDTILRLTAWQGQVNVSGGSSSRVVDQSKVDNELAYKANINVSGAAVGELAYSQAAGVDGARKIMGIAALTDAKYDPEAIGELINNTNMREILVKMRNHGCFIEDDDKTANAGDEGVNGAGDPANNQYVVNPRVQESTPSSGTDLTTGTRTLLDKDDQIVFPVNLLSVVGHTATAADENFSAGASLEINLTFKQSKLLDSSGGHADNTTTETA